MPRFAGGRGPCTCGRRGWCTTMCGPAGEPLEFMTMCSHQLSESPQRCVSRKTARPYRAPPRHGAPGARWQVEAASAHTRVRNAASHSCRARRYDMSHPEMPPSTPRFVASRSQAHHSCDARPARDLPLVHHHCPVSRWLRF